VTRIGTKRGDETSHVGRSDRLLKPQLCCALHFVYCAARLHSFCFAAGFAFDAVRISHYCVKKPLTYHACNSDEFFSAELGPHNASPGARGIHHTFPAGSDNVCLAPPLGATRPRVPAASSVNAHHLSHASHLAKHDPTCPSGPLFKREGMLLRPVAQLYGQVRTDWNQCFVIDCSLSHPVGHKSFTCSHSVLRNT